ncbi:geranylgeranylglycerol-phosphate geranylgeranyltransferase [Flavobacterium sp.]|uniref:geranylgeranylglycerol-phosphate geranylgeranyltransferase n=1 Tax=Flavobacterium sp. TaxID=239 RepID=UPI00263131FF|nr:geranylgeranylglycerol-phosphate geranylgeranyltransferase [Flavobacterium sp.]
MKYLNLIRYKNLLMIALMQLVLLYGFLKLQNIVLALAIWQYILLVISTVCIAAGGYIINNIFDQNTDLDNKPDDVIVGKSISESLAYNLYVGFTLVGVCIGFYLSNLILRPNFLLFFIIPSALLYIYATSLKQIMIVGNVIVAFMLSFSIIIIGIFMVFPATDAANKIEMTTVLSVLLDFAMIAFIINFIREMVKDLEDINGDYNQGMQTLPIVLGVARTTKLVFALSFIPILSILYYIYNNLFELLYATLYIFGFIVGPLLYFTIKIWTAKNKKDYHHLSTVLKLTIFFGIISIAVIGLNMKYHVA